MTPEHLKDMHGAIHTDAERKVRAGLLMGAIARKKEVKVSDDDVEQAFGELAAQSGKNVAKVKAEYREQGRREMLLSMILEDKVLDIIESSAKVTDGPAADASGTESTAAAAAPEAAEAEAPAAEKKPKKKKKAEEG